MTIAHTAVTRNLIADTVTALVDVSGPGTLIFTTGADVAVATLTFAATAFGVAAAGVCTAAAIVSDTSAVGHANAVDAFIIKDGAGLEVLRGSVGTSGEDINLSSLIIGAGDTVSVSALTYTAPA